MTALQAEKEAAIRSSYLFADLDDAMVGRLADASLIETAGKGRLVFEAGDEADGLRIVLSGLLRIWVNDDEGQELTITLAEAGDCLGEIALLDGAPRTANATVMESSRLLFLGQGVFHEILEGNFAFARQLIMLLCERLRRNTDDLSGFAFDDLQVRLARKIHELAFAHAAISGGGARFERAFSQTELAQMLGATREA
ncbi:MAG: Crp/Fnr family transcriptional regulator, partial [Pseudomonadota bacterium]